jgi:hypothetical protein
MPLTADQQALVVRHVPFARMVARQLVRDYREADELVSVAFMALTIAALAGPPCGDRAGLPGIRASRPAERSGGLPGAFPGGIPWNPDRGWGFGLVGPTPRVGI